MQPEYVPRISLADSHWGQFFDTALEQGHRIVTLTEHGISETNVAKLYDVAAQFFALPESVKLQYEIEQTGFGTGFLGFGYELAYGSDYPDLKESFELRPRYNNFPYYFPTETEVKDFQPTVLSMFHQLEQLAELVIDEVGIFLGLAPGEMSGMVRGGNHLFRISNYRPVKPEDLGKRAAEHVDINVGTLSLRATQPGFAGKGQHGKIIRPQDRAGDIRFHLGKMAQIYSQGRLKGFPHWVENGLTQRLSAQFFIQPRQEVVLGMRKRKPLTAGQVLQEAIDQFNQARRK